MATMATWSWHLFTVLFDHTFHDADFRHNDLAFNEYFFELRAGRTFGATVAMSKLGQTMFAVGNIPAVVHRLLDLLLDRNHDAAVLHHVLVATAVGRLAVLAGTMRPTRGERIRRSEQNQQTAQPRESFQSHIYFLQFNRGNL